MTFKFQQPKINHFFKIAEPPVVDISEEATTKETTTEADVSSTADNNSSDGLHTSKPSNDPEDVMLKTLVTKNIFLTYFN